MPVRHNNSVGNCCIFKYFGIRIISSSTDDKLPLRFSKTDYSIIGSYNSKVVLAQPSDHLTNGGPGSTPAGVKNINEKDDH